MEQYRCSGVPAFRMDFRQAVANSKKPNLLAISVGFAVKSASCT